MSGSGVGVLACERDRDPGIDWPSDSRLPAAAVRPTERPAALRNERRSSVEDWRIASLVIAPQLALAATADVSSRSRY
jgi:hypothetical protein